MNPFSHTPQMRSDKSVRPLINVNALILNIVRLHGLFGLNKWKYDGRYRDLQLTLSHDLHGYYNVMPTTRFQQLPGGIFSCTLAASLCTFRFRLCFCCWYNTRIRALFCWHVSLSMLHTIAALYRFFSSAVLSLYV